MLEDIGRLTRDIAAGNGEAFTRLYRDYFDMMYLHAARLSRRDEAFCLDVVQDSMMRVIRSLGPMESPAQLRRWLRRVVSSCVVDRIRADERRRRREERATRMRLAAGEPDQEWIAWLRGRLVQLGQAEVHLLRQRFQWGRTLRRIGEAVHLSPAAVDGRLNRTLKELRRQAQEECHEA